MNWEELSPKDKAAYIKIGIKNGITSIADIQKAYNSFASGGYKGDSEDNSIRLPEVTVTPDKWQKDFHKNFATEDTRKAMLEELKQEVARRQYAKDISGIHDRFMSGKILPEERKQLIGKALHRRATYGIDLYDAANRLYNVWNEAGRTKLTPEGSLINYIDINRPNYNPVINTAYRINNINDAITELSHPIQSKHGDIGFWGKLGNIPQTIWGETIRDGSHYNNPNHYEYETHNVIQPELERYIYEGIPTKYIPNSFDDGGKKNDITWKDRLLDALSYASAALMPATIINPTIRGRISNMILRNTEGQGDFVADGIDVLTGAVRPQYYDGNIHFIEDPNESSKLFNQTNYTTYNYSKKSPLELYTKGDFSKETISPYGKGVYEGNKKYGKLNAYLGNLYGDTIYMSKSQKPYIDRNLNIRTSVNKDSLIQGADTRYLKGTIDARSHYVTPEVDNKGNYRLFMEDVWDTKPIIDIFNHPYIYNQKPVIQFTEDKEKLNRIPRLSTLYEDIEKKNK